MYEIINIYIINVYFYYNIMLNTAVCCYTYFDDRNVDVLFLNSTQKVLNTSFQI